MIERALRHVAESSKALHQVDDGTGHGDPGRSRGVAGGIETDGAHVQIAAGLVAVVTVPAENNGTHEHHHGNPADNERRQPR
ncbi:hypothetical protein [Arthrobacter sp. B2a2-09]|uniref:hypothetical protein n=1 Tax=Arthrobacter sp. B2a2-09 TaxID=2952822 RepID=UPI0022CD97E8|nr:hypothetical protein [Arthrobacter sp. B2a2-09]MCZ9882256.1 hypothetical protein [Arthrobacter sp. B2a2-09]